MPSSDSSSGKLSSVLRLLVCIYLRETGPRTPPSLPSEILRIIVQELNTRQPSYPTHETQPSIWDLQTKLRQQAEDDLSFFNLMYVNQCLRIIVLEAYHNESSRDWNCEEYEHKLKALQVEEARAILVRVMGEDDAYECRTISDFMKVITKYEAARDQKMEKFVLKKVTELAEQTWSNPPKIYAAHLAILRRLFSHAYPDILGPAWSALG